MRAPIPRQSHALEDFRVVLQRPFDTCSEVDLVLEAELPLPYRVATRAKTPTGLSDRPRTSGR